MNKLELVEEVVAKTGATKKEAEKIINVALDLVVEHLVAGDVVKLTDFGTFAVKTRKERHGTNPKTAAPITIPAAKTVGFKASKKIKARL